jgi:hypothetical protein
MELPFAIGSLGDASTGTASGGTGITVEPVGARVIDGRPEPGFVGARPTPGCNADDLVGVRPIAGPSSCCDGARPTTGASSGDGATTGEASPIVVCEPLFVGARLTTACDIGVRPIAGDPIIVCELVVGARFVIARGNGGGTLVGRSPRTSDAVGVRPVTVLVNAAASTGASESGIDGVPVGRRCGIGGGCDGRAAVARDRGSTAVCSSFVAIRAAGDAPGEPAFSLE